MDTEPVTPTPAAPPSPPAPGRSFLGGRRLSSSILAGGAALAMTLAGLGIASAQTDPPAAPPATEAPAESPDEAQAPAEKRHADGPRRRDHHGGMKASPAVIAKVLGITAQELKAAREAGKSLATIAGERGVDVSTLVDAMAADVKAHLAEHVAAGRITQEQADRRTADLEARITKMVNRAPASKPHGHRRGPGRGLKGNLEAAATALGVTPEELRAELQEGKSLAAIAQERDVDVAKVVDALVADAKARLDAAVAAGHLTRAQADAKAANLEARITDLVNHTPPAGGPRHHRRHDGGTPDQKRQEHQERQEHQDYEEPQESQAEGETLEA